MANTIRMRAQTSNGVCTVRALIRHPMETGQRKNNKTGQTIPAHFIKEVNVVHNGNTVVDAQWSAAISANPYFSFEFSNANAGDELTLSWVDNKGEKDSATTKI